MKKWILPSLGHWGKIKMLKINTVKVDIKGLQQWNKLTLKKWILRAPNSAPVGPAQMSGAQMSGDRSNE